MSLKGTWKFPWGLTEVSYLSNSRYVLVTTLVLELRALGFFNIGHIHVTVFQVFSTSSQKGTWTFPCVFLRWLYTSSSHFVPLTILSFVLELRALGIFFYYGTYVCNSFLGFFPHHLTLWHTICQSFMVLSINSFITNNNLYSLLITTIIHHQKWGPLWWLPSLLHLVELVLEVHIVHVISGVSYGVHANDSSRHSL
jgi:hypothetical protein